MINLSITTIQVIATEADLTFTSALWMLVSHGKFSDFANDCAAVGGKIFIRYPIGLNASHRLSDAS